MTRFCTKCGASLPEDATAFCSSCGAPVGTPAVPPPTEYSASPTPQPVMAPMSPSAYGQPAPRSGGVLKVVLIVVGIFVVVGVLGVGTVSYLGYRALHSAGNSFSLGSTVANSDLGVPVYPGAAAKGGGGAKVKLGNTSMVTATYTTSDPVNSVVEFYRGKVGGQAIESNGVRGTSFESTTINGALKDSLVVTISADPSGNGTQIVILHTTASTSSS